MSNNALAIFREAGALQEGHFLLTSGLHSPVYWEKFRVLQYPRYTQELCHLIAMNYRNEKVEVVAGPTTGGIIIAYEVARHLGTKGVFAEKEGTTRVFRRGFHISPGQRVLVVDDILTTGSSVTEVIAAVKLLQGAIIGIGVLVDRSPKPIDFGFPLFSCLKTTGPVYRSTECPMCSAGIPLVKPGGQSQG